MILEHGQGGGRDARRGQVLRPEAVGEPGAGHVTLAVRAPFHLEATVRLLQRRPASRIDRWGEGAYRRVLPAGGERVVCTVRNVGSVDAPRLELSLEPRGVPTEQVAAVERTLARVLGLDEEPGFTVPGCDDPRLRVLARALRGTRPPRFPSLFESLCRVVPYQQLSLEAGAALVSRFVERFGRRLEAASGTAWAFPEPAEVAAAPAERFAGMGFSGTKIRTLRHVASLVSAGGLREEDLERLPTGAAQRLLDALPGIGPWSAEVVLLRGFRRLDVFPGGDVGARRGLERLLGERAPIDRIVERAGGRRGILYFYALAAQLLERGLIHPAAGHG